MSYEFLIDDEEPHLGGNIREGDPQTFSPRVWDYLVFRFAIKSVMDLGSGMGYAAHFFHNHHIPVIAVDGLQYNVDNAVYPTVRHDLTKGPVTCKVDLVVCIETVEHVAAEHIDNLMRSLACGKYIVMSHADPGQPGWNHINCQSANYWHDMMIQYGCKLLDIDTERVRRLAGQDGASHLQRSGMVFARREG